MRHIEKKRFLHQWQQKYTPVLEAVRIEKRPALQDGQRKYRRIPRSVDTIPCQNANTPARMLQKFNLPLYPSRSIMDRSDLHVTSCVSLHKLVLDY